jgi:hypothetical protein
MFRAVFIAILVSFYGNAQNLVTISDPNFELFLNERYPSCMREHQLDISCSEIINEEVVDLNAMNIENVDAIQYFLNLKSFSCVENKITSLPQLPSNLLRLDIGMNQLIRLPELPKRLEELSCADNLLTSLPSLPASLKILYCNFNRIAVLPELPISLEYLACGSNELSCLPFLPESIFIGDVSLNPLKCIPSKALWMDEESLKLPVCNQFENFISDLSCICIAQTLLSTEQIGVKEKHTNDLNISPNPTQGSIHIRVQKELSLIRVFDTRGQVVLDNFLSLEDAMSSEITLDLSQLIDGIYFIETTVNEVVSIAKVIKKN